MIEVRFEVRDDQPVAVLASPGAVPRSVQLTGPRATATGTATAGGAGWSGIVPLHGPRWGGPDLPLPSGEYALVVDGAETGADDVTPGGSPSPHPVILPTLRASWDGRRVMVGPPIDPALETTEAQDALEARYAGRRGELENAVFFESFYGRVAADNPRAIDRELARVAPSATRYWSVVDLSVAVPEGAVPLIEGSPEWWRARGAARLLVVNDWLRRRFVRRPGQRVLQTWHGTPLKRLALHRPGFDPRRMLAVVRESRRWDILLAQNPFGAETLRKAYAFLRRPVWVEGYPRNDELASGDGGRVRSELGIAADERVLLYAPTWRDDRDTIVDFIDPAALAAAADAVVLVRGHSRTLLPGADERGPRVVDVTGHPDLAGLQLASDALITDYSSMMFDYSVTGRPMYFLVPDLERYRGEQRGFYFDLARHAPGPLVQTFDELVDALRVDPARDAAVADRYRAWRQRFNARDDGRSAERVVARILDQGLIERG